MRQEQARLQVALKESDKNFRRRAQELPNPGEVTAALESFQLHPYNPSLRTLGFPLGLSGRQVKRIVSVSPELYKIHRVYLAALYLRSLGNAVSTFEAIPQFRFLQKIKNGNWFDLAIIAQGSQFDLLISNDEDQRAICNFLHSKSMVKSKAITLRDFLSGSES
jgi:hypothetical protein